MKKIHHFKYIIVIHIDALKLKRLCNDFDKWQNLKIDNSQYVRLSGSEDIVIDIQRYTVFLNLQHHSKFLRSQKSRLQR